MEAYFKFWAFMILLTLMIIVLLTGCVSGGPAAWQPAEHAALMQSCRQACYPGRVAAYISMDGSCECTKREPRAKP